MKAVLIPTVFAAVSSAVGVALELFGVEDLIAGVTGLPKGSFGPLFLAYVFNIQILTFLGICVGGARKQYGIKYPTMYAS